MKIEHLEFLTNLHTEVPIGISMFAKSPSPAPEIPEGATDR